MTNEHTPAGELKRVTWPPCGCCEIGTGIPCMKPAVWQIGGVGFCHDHEDEAGPNPERADSLDDFDPWWCAATIDAANGGTRFKHLGHNQWPAGGAA